MKYLLDTNVCVDVLRGDSRVIARLEKEVPNNCAVSTVTRYELAVGVWKCREPKQEARKVNALLSQMHELSFDPSDAGMAAAIRAELESRGAMIGPYDILLAAQAIQRGLTLVTANCDEYSRVDQLRWENWKTS